MSPLINKDILSNIEIIHDSYINNISQVKSNYFCLVTSPFKVLKLRNLLLSPVLKKELQVALETLKLSKKDNDLYSLWQSEDLNNFKLKPFMKFINILKKEVGPLLSNICNVELNEKLSITASLYNSGDVLLCHDDKCEDRCIAFVYYLTGSDKSGGSFDMFDHDENNQPTEVVHSLPPEENSFICFEVGNLTYHQVSEVTDEKFQRWSINGWFHSNRELPVMVYEDPMPVLLSQINVEGLTFLDQYINLVYCTPSNLVQMREQFENESFILLKEMFCSKLYESCTKEITECSSLSWKRVGPANRRHYYAADLSNLPEALNTMVKLVMSPLFISFLRNITSLSLVPFEVGGKQSSELTLQLIKWLPGCYTMATDNDAFFKKPGLDLYMFFCSAHLSSSNDSSGFITYLDTGDDEDSVNDENDQGDKELITIVPEDNVLALVFRTDNTVRFTKYINHSVEKVHYAIYATFYEVENL